MIIKYLVFFYPFLYMYIYPKDNVKIVAIMAKYCIQIVLYYIICNARFNGFMKEFTTRMFLLL